MLPRPDPSLSHVLHLRMGDHLQVAVHADEYDHVQYRVVVGVVTHTGSVVNGPIYRVLQTTVEDSPLTSEAP